MTGEVSHMSREQIITALRNDLPFLKAQFGVRRIGVFGSVAAGRETDASDVDILADFERPIGLRFVEFSEHLEKLLGRPADVLTPAGIDSIRNRRIADTIKTSIRYV
jgi:predicted nucleotidyltransferase